MEPQALGRYLRESREANELRLEDAVQRLRIRRHILESFEQGDFNVADTPVRVRGMLRNYARFLGLEEDKVLGFYEASQQEQQPRTGGWFGLARQDTTPENPVAPERVTDTPPALPKVETETPGAAVSSSGVMQRLNILLKNIAMLLVSVAALAVIGFVIMQTVNPPQPLQPVVQQATPTVSGSATMTFTPIFTSTPAPTQLTPDINFSDFSGVNVDLTMTGRSWMRVWVDENETFVGILEPDETQQFTGNNQVRLVAANAAALGVTFNGDEQPVFGARGQQVEVTFSTDGVSVDVQSAGEQPTVQPSPTMPPTETQLPGFPTFTPPPPTPTPLAMPEASPTWTPDVPSAQSSAQQSVAGDPDTGGDSVGLPPVDSATSQTDDPTPTPLPLGNNPAQVNPTATPATGTQADGLPPAPVDPVNPAATAISAASATPSPTMTATVTLTPQGTPTATSILPPRATSTGRPPTKQP
jgi:cytoskeletal protein RodZ